MALFKPTIEMKPKPPVQTSQVVPGRFEQFSFPSLELDYKTRWEKFVINLDSGLIAKVALRLAGSKTRYQSVQAETGVPWQWIACVHEREASQAWNLSLAQGDPWAHVSTHVPKGRGPFTSWEAAAIDALQYEKLDKVPGWSIERMLYEFEEYNGFGYRRKGVISPYVWSHTDQYHGGKYVADGVYDPETWDAQIGCAPILKHLLA